MRAISGVKSLLLITLLCCCRLMVLAQADPIEHIWYNEEQIAKIQVYKVGADKFFGKIIWLKEPNRDGKPKTDIHNPDKARQNDPEIGLVVLKNFRKAGANGYEDGTIYDPKNGKTYSCKMTLEGNELHVRGYIGFSLLGRTTTWTRAD